MISKLQQAGSCPAHRLWPGRQLEVLTGLGQERYPAHGLWPGLARPRARIPTASGQDSHGLWPFFCWSSLTRLTVYKKSRPLTSKRIGAGSLIPILQNVEQWMVSMGWTEDAVGEWITLFAQLILDAANRHQDETYDHIKSAIGSVLEGSSYSDKRQRR